MLRVHFQAGKSDTPTLMVATFLRFCSDGSLRGPDNYIVARCVEGLWQIGGRGHRELECEGPVRVRIISREGEAAVQHGPFRQLRTIAGVLHADECSLQVCMPGRANRLGSTCHEIAFLP